MKTSQVPPERLVAFHGLSLVLVATHLFALGLRIVRKSPLLLFVAFFLGLLGIITLLPLF